MAHTQQLTHSLWQDRAAFPALPSLNQSLQTDVCIVGAGIAGLLTAYRLQKNGRSVVILEKDLLGFNETAHSTAHVSNALDDRYSKLRKWHGREGARLAYNSHTAALELLENIITEENILCDFQRVPGFLFLSPQHDKRILDAELASAHDAGFFDAHLTPEPDEEFFEAGLCLKFPHQAQLDPVKLMRGLCEVILGRGGRIYIQTQGVKFQGGAESFVQTTSGHRVSCEDIVVATNVPINDWMTIHTKEAAYRTYAIGIKIPPPKKAPALFWDTEDPYHYIRYAKDPGNGEPILIVGGEDHRTGQGVVPEDCFSRLRDWAERRLKVEGEIIASWSGQIIEPMDGLAYIGRNPGDHNNIYIATGDSGHGISHGAIASMIISDLIVAGNHPWEHLYDPRRFNWKGVTRFLKENIMTGVQYRDWISTGNNRNLDDLLVGEGCVISEGLSKVAVYRNSDGSLQTLSAVCPHMGGIVRWNDAEETWDCPCHGSRFNKFGEVLNGPSLSNMSQEERFFEEPTKRTPEVEARGSSKKARPFSK